MIQAQSRTKYPSDKYLKLPATRHPVEADEVFEVGDADEEARGVEAPHKNPITTVTSVGTTSKGPATLAVGCIEPLFTPYIM